jgi:hypothetical protein
MLCPTILFITIRFLIIDCIKLGTVTSLSFNLDLRNTTLGYGFHFQQRTPRILPIESFVHDTGRNLFHAEYDYLKGSKYTNS